MQHHHHHHHFSKGGNDDVRRSSSRGGAIFVAIEYRAPNVIPIPILGAVGVGKAEWIATAIRLLEVAATASGDSIEAAAFAIATRGRRQGGGNSSGAMIRSGHRSGFSRLNFYGIQTVQAPLMRHLASCKRFIIMFDVRSRASLVDNVDAFLAQIQHFDPPAGENDVPKIVLLVANKVERGQGGEINDNAAADDNDEMRGIPVSTDGSLAGSSREPNHDETLVCEEARRIAEEGGFMYAETVGSTGEGVMEALLLLLHRLPHTPFMTALNCEDPSLLCPEFDELSIQ